MRRVVLLFIAILTLSGTASAQFDLSKALGSLLGGDTEQSTTTPYDELAEAAPSRSAIMGTWQYKAARLEYLGGNSLAGAAISQLEGVVAAELKRWGVVEGCCSLTLRRNGMAVIATRDALQDCTFMYNTHTAQMQLSVLVDGRSFSIDSYVKMPSNRMAILLDAKDVMDMVLKLQPELANNSSVVAVKSILDNFSDIYISIIFVR